jgi:hypothetical protein
VAWSAEGDGTWWREPGSRFLVALPPGWRVLPDNGGHILTGSPPGPGEFSLTIVDGGAAVGDIDAREVIAEGAEAHPGATYHQSLGLTRAAYSERAYEAGREFYLYTWEIGLRGWVSVWSFRIAADLYPTEPARVQFAEVRRVVDSLTL